MRIKPTKKCRRYTVRKLERAGGTGLKRSIAKALKFRDYVDVPKPVAEKLFGLDLATPFAAVVEKPKLVEPEVTQELEVETTAALEPEPTLALEPDDDPTEPVSEDEEPAEEPEADDD